MHQAGIGGGFQVFVAGEPQVTGVIKGSITIPFFVQSTETNPMIVTDTIVHCIVCA